MRLIQMLLAHRSQPDRLLRGVIDRQVNHDAPFVLSAAMPLPWHHNDLTR
jgi:hypothetical protein